MLSILKRTFIWRGTVLWITSYLRPICSIGLESFPKMEISTTLNKFYTISRLVLEIICLHKIIIFNKLLCEKFPFLNCVELSSSRSIELKFRLNSLKLIQGLLVSFFFRFLLKKLEWLKYIKKILKSWINSSSIF